MENKEYWEDRSVKLLLEAEMSAVDYFDNLDQAYKYSLVLIRREINDFFEKYAKQVEKTTGRRVSFVEARKLLIGNEHADFQTQLREWAKTAEQLGLSTQYSEHLKKLSQRVHITRLEALEESIRYQIEELAGKRVDGLMELRQDNYIASYYKSYYDLSSGVAVGVNFSKIDTRMLEKVFDLKREGTHYSSRIWGDTQKLLESLNKLLPQSFTAGLSSKQIGDMLATQMGVSNRVARNLVRTEINFITNQGTLDMYKAAGVEEYQYLATLDMRTTEICRSLHLKVFPVSKSQVGLNYPPMHNNCRSTTIANYEDEEDLEIAARDLDGKTIYVPKTMSQVEWIKAYVPQEQQERLLRFVDKYKYVEE